MNLKTHISLNFGTCIISVNDITVMQRMTVFGTLPLGSQDQSELTLSLINMASRAACEMFTLLTAQ